MYECADFINMNSTNRKLFNFRPVRFALRCLHILYFLHDPVLLHHEKHQGNNAYNNQYDTAPVESINAAYYSYKNAYVVKQV
jgi:hypothetical protein